MNTFLLIVLLALVAYSMAKVRKQLNENTRRRINREITKANLEIAMIRFGKKRGSV